MSITKYTILNPDPILEQASLAEGTVARIAHVNDLIDQINTSFGYDVLGFDLVAGNGGSTTPAIQGVGARGVAGNASNGGCRAGTVPYTYSNGTTGCINAILRQTYADYLPVVARTSTGVYTFTFPKTPPLGYSILLSPTVVSKSRADHIRSASLFTISTTNAAGDPADGILPGMYLEIKIYN